ncbi:hypothetical protein A6770_25840 [Nostoc minutum NIES-26]|uniref:Uncharacterized protein n=1 Tax=Nostoc minutum NIES-26 TaxID=1844469 RepID=A0A367QSV5_9NOSO|nr:hypothetical protein A6770_25840 [Nostoc minutum NIES-26]
MWFWGATALESQYVAKVPSVEVTAVRSADLYSFSDEDASANAEPAGSKWRGFPHEQLTLASLRPRGGAKSVSESLSVTSVTRIAKAEPAG